MKTNKKYFTLLLLSVLGLFARGQSLSPSALLNAGNWYSSAAGSLSWSLGEAFVETYASQQNMLSQGFQQTYLDARLTGQLTYSNGANTIMPGVTIYLQTLQGTKADSAMTNSSGYFAFMKTPPGSYVFSCAVTTAWGGVNSIDALLVLRHFVGLAYLQGIYAAAADVDNSHYINSADALAIARRFAGLQSSFNLPDWIISTDTVTIGYYQVVKHLKAICAGDVNGSYIPQVKSTANVAMENEGQIWHNGKDEVLFPLVTTDALVTGAVSLVLYFPESLVKINNIYCKNNKKTMVYHQAGGELRIAWYSTEPLVLDAHDTLMHLNLTLFKPVTREQSLSLFSVGAESEIADETGLRYALVRLSTPGILSSVNEDLPDFLCITPNPTNGFARFHYRLPEAGEVRFSIMNMIGGLIVSLPAGKQQAGLQQFHFDGSWLAPGTYLVRMDAHTGSDRFSHAKKMVITR